MSEFDKRLGYIVDVLVQDGAVICRVEDKDTPNKIYDPVLYGRSSPKTVSVPPKGTQAMIEKVSGEWIITNIISTPSESGFDETKAKTGFENEAASMSLVFGPRESADGPEYINVEYDQDGYDININVDGNVNIQADEGFSILDGNGHGIEALDGAGEFKWYANDVDFDSTATGNTQ